MKFAVNFKRKEILLVNRDSLDFCSEKVVAIYCLIQVCNCRNNLSNWKL